MHRQWVEVIQDKEEFPEWTHRFALYGPPFNHRKPLPGSRYTGEFCDYAGILKELTYTIYRKQEIRNAIFDKLGHSTPSTVASYRRFIAKKRAGGLLGVYEVLDAYLELRQAVSV